MLINFCENSRVHSGLRLMKRACRHCTYPNEPDMRDATFDIGIYQGHIYLKISKDVAASYHTKSSAKTYFSEVICTSNDLLCTACECTVGPKKKTVLRCSVSGTSNPLDEKGKVCS